MTVQMNIAEAKAKLSELVARAEAGEEVVIARDGVPVVVMAPVVKAGVRRFGFLAEGVDTAGWNPESAMDEDDPRDWGIDDDDLMPRSER
jgi:prevent-host-death family protein